LEINKSNKDALYNRAGPNECFLLNFKYKGPHPIKITIIPVTNNDKKSLFSIIKTEIYHFISKWLKNMLPQEDSNN